MIVARNRLSRRGLICLGVALLTAGLGTLSGCSINRDRDVRFGGESYAVSESSPGTGGGFVSTLTKPTGDSEQESSQSNGIAGQLLANFKPRPSIVPSGEVSLQYAATQAATASPDSTSPAQQQNEAIAQVEYAASLNQTGPEPGLQVPASLASFGMKEGRRQDTEPSIAPGPTLSGSDSIRLDEPKALPTAEQDDDPLIRPEMFSDSAITAAIDAVIPNEFGSDLGSDAGLFDGEFLPNGEAVGLNQIVQAAVRYYPEVQQAIAGREVAAGDLLSATGAFDYKLKAYALAMPLGFYQNQRAVLGAEQPMYGGGSLRGGYKYGDGDLQPWYKERETNEGGEFSMGFDMPLVRNRTIDDRRSQLLQSEQDVLAVEPIIRQQSLDVSLFAANAYWTWQAANAKLAVQQQLLDLGLVRKTQVEKRIKVGDLAPAAQVENLRLIAQRKAKLVDSQRKVESSAIKLSLYYRDETGSPILLGRSIENAQFPKTSTTPLNDFRFDQSNALGARPELEYLQRKLAQYQIQLQQAMNESRPEVNWVFDIGKDVGGAASSSRDKTPIELESGLSGGWEPLQRKALGKARAIRGKMTQLDLKRRLTEDKITAELRDARSALNAAARKVQQTQANADLAGRALENALKSFAAGDIDLIILNISEQADADARTDLIDAQSEYRFATAAYQIAQGQLPTE